MMAASQAIRMIMMFQSFQIYIKRIWKYFGDSNCYNENIFNLRIYNFSVKKFSFLYIHIYIFV